MSIPRTKSHEDLQKRFRHLPRWIGRRLQDGQPIVTEANGKELRKKIDALLRRSAKPDTEYQVAARNAERIVIIDSLTRLRINTHVIECMHGLLWADESTIKAVREMLTGAKYMPAAAPAAKLDREPPPEPDKQAVDSFIAKLTKTADPFRGNWSDKENCYVMVLEDGNPEIGIAPDDWLYAKYKTPEPGDLIIFPADPDSKRLYIGHFVSSQDGKTRFHTSCGVREFAGDCPPLVVTKIRKHDDHE